jgi:membrane protein
MKKQPTPKELYLIGSSLLPSLLLFRKNDPLRMAGATAFFTTFALPPIVFIIARIFGWFLSPKEVGQGLIENLSNSLGAEGAQQVREVIKSIRGFNQSWYVIVFGFLFLLFVATTLFIVIKNSFNQVWQVTVKQRPGFTYNMGTRLRSFAAIVLVGLLFFANLFFKSIETMGGNYLDEVFHGGSIYFKLIFSEFSGIIIVSAWFIILFRYLADGRPRWKAAIIGGLLTGLLFTGGRVLLRIILIDGNIGKLYGASGSFVLVLLFVFYTSFILYYGASFIAVYSHKKNWPLHPDDKSYNVKTVAK